MIDKIRKKGDHLEAFITTGLHENCWLGLYLRDDE
jgi:hypothetical protein